MNTITIELCAEDRARLDKLNEGLEALSIVTANLGDTMCGRPIVPVNVDAPDELTAKLQAVVDRAKAAQEEPKETTPSVTPEPEETPAPAEETKPTVTLEQIQQKVIQLAAGFNGTKKAKVREIINAYAKKVTDLPEDKWDEVMDKLTALEKEVTEA
jgi:hypothetical protein